MYVNVHSFINYSKKSETTKINRPRVGEWLMQTVVYSYNEILPSNTKGMNYLCYESQEH